ncbi:MAG TPA: type IV pilus assembly protein PilM, partial [Methyloradius sp.]
MRHPFTHHRKNSMLLGLDIGLSEIKLIELSRDAENNICLERCASAPLPRGAIADGNIENLAQVTDVVRYLWKISGTRSRHVALSIPSAAAITRKISMPAGINEYHLAALIETEGRQQLPFLEADACIDFLVIGPATHSPNKIEVMVAAARRDVIEDRVAIAEAANLTPMVVDIDSYAANTAISHLLTPHDNEEAPVALLQIGMQKSHLSLRCGNQIVYDREHAFGGIQLTQAIVHAYELPYEEAEARKKSGDLPSG